VFSSNRKKVRSRVIAPEEVSFKRHIIRGLLSVVILSILLYGTYYVTRLQAFTITDVTVAGGETISHEEVRAHVENELVGNYYALIPKRFTYYYPHDRILEVLEKIPRIHDVQVSIEKRTHVHVTFAEYIPHALWCVYEKEEKPCYFLTDDGYAFAEAPSLHGGALTRHSIEGVEEISSGTVIDPETLSKIDMFSDRISDELGLRVTSIVHKKNSDLEFLVNGGGSILVSSGKDYETTFDNLKSVLTSKEFKHIEPGNFKYVDVRFDNKVFVNEDFSTDASTTATTTLPE
jgi:cell division septal protein FtsQ